MSSTSGAFISLSKVDTPFHVLERHKNKFVPPKISHPNVLTPTHYTFARVLYT